MQVILLEKVDNLGSIGDMVKVKSGYGRNYLIPQGKAALATKINITKFEAMRADLEKRAAEELENAQKRAEHVKEMAVTIAVKAGSEGKLFGSVGTFDIVEAFERAGCPIERSEVRLPAGPLRVVGEHEIEIHLHTDVTVPVTLNIVADE
ncbi:MAG: 50S ribosomal protein L9 [Gammaproteobacteria bacterium]|nr:50S ribosomal protein L9 [Gammaproteobacteria bacterium]